MIPLVESADQPKSAPTFPRGVQQLPLDSTPVDAPEIQIFDKVVKIGMSAAAAMQQEQHDPRNLGLDGVQAIDKNLHSADNQLCL